jgi:uncharacterized integral membrane protein
MAEQGERQRDTGAVIRLVAVVAVVAVLAAFVIDNTKSVKVGFVFTDKETPLIFVLVITALIGVLLDRLFIWARRR